MSTRVMVLNALFGLALVGLSGCKQDDAGAATIAPTATSTPAGDPLPLDHPAVELPPTSRGMKRLTVAQLRNSLPVIAGNGDTWTFGQGDKAIDLLEPDALGRTLGEPDYIQVTVEAAEPTALYVKFMDDMARDVCAKMSASGELERFQDVDANARYLKLRLLGEKIADDDTESVADLRAVHEAGGWVPACVALMTSPAFHLY